MARPTAPDPKEKINVRLPQSKIRRLKKMVRDKKMVFSEIIDSAVDDKLLKEGY